MPVIPSRKYSMVNDRIFKSVLTGCLEFLTDLIAGITNQKAEDIVDWLEI